MAHDTSNQPLEGDAFERNDKGNALAQIDTALVVFPTDPECLQFSEIQQVEVGQQSVLVNAVSRISDPPPDPNPLPPIEEIEEFADIDWIVFEEENIFNFPN
jgi:hypothetical protein